MSNPLFIDRIKKAISRQDINELKLVIDLIDDQNFEIHRIKYKYVYDFLQTLIKRTIFWSIFTAIIIIICLSFILPFDNFFLKHNCLLNSLIAFIIVSISFCFFGLIFILRKSLKDTGYPLLSN